MCLYLHKCFFKCLHEINHTGGNNPGSRAIYKEANETIDKYCEMIKLWVFKVTVHGGMALNLAITMFVYIANGIDNEYDYSFAFPLW